MLMQTAVSVILSFGLSLSLLAHASSPVLTGPRKITVGIVSGESKESFESKVAPFFKSQWSQCNFCELKNLSRYDEAGKLDAKTLVSQLELTSDDISFLLIDVNWKYRAEDHKGLVDFLKKKTQAGVLVLGTTGYPKEGESSASIAKTVLGQIPDVVILGEINDRERLALTSYYGPEMLTAVKPPRDYMGQALGPAYFAARLAQNFSRRMPQDWLSHLRSQKIKSRKIWPQVEDFF